MFMHDIAPEVVSIAEACLGGLQGRSALLVGPEEQRCPYVKNLRRAKMKYIYQEDTPGRIAYLLPYVQLFISMPSPSIITDNKGVGLTAARIAKGCEGRQEPLLIFDLAATSSVDELAGLLPEVCLYTPDDLQRILQRDKRQAKAS
jgi:hypothetical protein